MFPKGTTNVNQNSIWFSSGTSTVFKILCHFLFWIDQPWVPRRTYHLMPFDTRSNNVYDLEVWIETVFKIYVHVLFRGGMQSYHALELWIILFACLWAMRWTSSGFREDKLDMNSLQATSESSVRFRHTSGDDQMIHQLQICNKRPINWESFKSFSVDVNLKTAGQIKYWEVGQSRRKKNKNFKEKAIDFFLSFNFLTLFNFFLILLNPSLA